MQLFATPPSPAATQSPLSPDLAQLWSAVLVTGGGAVSGGSSAALSQGDEQPRPISYAGLGPWV